MKVIYFYTNVTLGYGNQNYLNLARILCNIGSAKVRFIEPLDIDRKYVVIKDDSYIRSVWFLGLGNIIRDAFPRLLTRLVFKFLNIVYSCAFLLVLFVFVRPKYLIVAKYHPLIAFFSRWCMVSFYCTELFEVEKRKGFLFDRFRSYVACVVAPQKDRREILKAMFPKAKTYLVQNCPLLSRYKVVERNLKSGSFTVLYQGRIGRESNAEMLFDLICKTPSRFYFQLAGPVDVEYVLRLKEIVNSRSNVTYFGYLNSMALDVLRSECDIGLVTWTDSSKNTKFCAPNKLYEYIANGMYVISFDNHSMRDLNKTYKFGFVPEKGEGKTSVLEKFQTLTREELEHKKIWNRELYEGKLNYEAQSKDFVKWFSSL